MSKFTTKLIDLEPDQCRWPEGCIHSGIFFCAEPSIVGNSYCQEHKDQSTRPTRNMTKKRKKETEQALSRL